MSQDSDYIPPESIDWALSVPEEQSREPSPIPRLRREIIPPRRVKLLPYVDSPRPNRSRWVAVSLTEEAVWLQDTWELRCLVLPEVTGIEDPGEGKELIFTAGSRKVHLKFGSAEAAKGFYQAMEEGE